MSDQTRSGFNASAPTLQPSTNEPSQPKNPKPQDLDSILKSSIGARKKASRVADLLWNNTDLREFVNK